MTPAMPQIVTPLDPDSAKGREVAERLGNILAEIEREIADAEKRPADAQVEAAA